MKSIPESKELVEKEEELTHKLKRMKQLTQQANTNSLAAIKLSKSNRARLDSFDEQKTERYLSLIEVRVKDISECYAIIQLQMTIITELRFYLKGKAGSIELLGKAVRAVDSMPGSWWYRLMGKELNEIAMALKNLPEDGTVFDIRELSAS